MKHLKEEFDKLTFKETLIYSLAFLSLIAGFTLLFIGLFTAPEGEIHDSVLTAFGINLLFVASLLGISMHYASQLTGFKKAVTDLLLTHNIDTDKLKDTEKNADIGKRKQRE